MASRYWVGGTASWDGTAGTKWALTSGGVGGQTVPSASDDVFFDAASGAVTVTKASTASCRSLDFTGFTGTFAGAFSTTVVTDITLSPTMTNSYTGVITKTLAGTITSNGVSFLSSFNINTSGSDVTLFADDFETTEQVTLTAGTLDAATNNVNVKIKNLLCSNSNTRTLNMGNGTWEITSDGVTTPWTCSIATNLTINCGLSTIKFTGTGSHSKAFIGGAGNVYNNIWFNGGSSGPYLVLHSNTFNNIRCDGGNAVPQVVFTAGITVTASSLTLGNSSAGVQIMSDTAGSSYTLSGTLSADYTAVSDAVASGLTITDGLDFGGNTGVTFVSSGGGGGFAFGAI